MARQLPLGVSLRDDATFENFYPGDNQHLVSLLQAGSEQFIFLYGSPGTGKSHLLQALCHHAGANGQTAIFLPLSDEEFIPEMLQGMESLSLICIDDLQSVAGDAHWEEALFHLYNRMREQGHRLVIAADRPLHSLPVQLADLLSRLAWGVVYQLQDVSDEEKARVLQWRASKRGMQLGDDVAAYLIKHSPRSFNALFELLDRLDKESLAAQRRLTIPFVKPYIGSDEEP